MARTRFPVETRQASPVSQTSRRAPLTPAVKAEYIEAGLTPGAAHRLWAHGVTPDLFWDYTHLLGATTSEQRLCRLSSTGITPALYRAYPKGINDDDMVMLHQTGVSPAQAQHYADLFGWVNSRNYGHLAPMWTVVPHLVKRNISDEAVTRSIEACTGSGYSASDVVFVAELRIPTPIVRKSSSYTLRGKTLKVWRSWVMEAQGNVRLAYAVAENGGQLDDVAAWGATGFSLDRIANLAAVGNVPPASETVAHDMAELTDEDLAVWAALSQFSAA